MLFGADSDLKSQVWVDSDFSSTLEEGNRFANVRLSNQRKENTVPTGKVKWYDTEKGFGFLQTDEGEEVFLHASALPAGTLTLKNGTRCEFGVADGKRGMQALSVRVLEAPPSVAKGGRKDAEDMAIVLEDVIKLLDGYAGNLRRGRYPDDKQTEKLVAVLRGVADQIDA